MVLTGSINKQIVSGINAAGGRAVGLSGKDSMLILARKLEKNGVDLGFVGEPQKVNPEVLHTVMRSEMVAGHRADRLRRVTAKPTTSTPTRWPARSPAR